MKRLLLAGKKISSLLHLSLLSLFLLMSCKLFATDVNESSQFKQFLERVESLQKTKPKDAAALLASWQTDISTYAIEERLYFLKVKAEILVDQAQFDIGLATASEGIALAQELPSPTILMADLFYARGFSYENLGNYQSAVQEYLNGLEVSESLNDSKYVAYGLANLGAIYYLTDRFEKSLIVLNDALKTASKTDDDELKGFVNSELGILYAYIGQGDKSLEFYQNAYQHYKNSGLTSYALSTLMNIAANHSVNKRYQQAIAAYKEVIAAGDNALNNQIFYSAYSGLAWAHMKKENSDPETAYQYMLIAGQYVDGLQQYEIPLIYAMDNAYILESNEKYQEALESLAEAERILAGDSQRVSGIPQSNILKLKADIYFDLKEYEKAYQFQSLYLAKYSQVRERNNDSAIEELRLEHETQRVELENKVLEQINELKKLELNDANQKVKTQQFYVALIAALVLIFAYFLIKVVKGQKSIAYRAKTDALTGIANRRHVMAVGEQHVKSAINSNEPLSLLLLDIDNFKQINDTCGHKTGDGVLKKIAEIGNLSMRKTDVFGRVGGEEFVALLPHTALLQAAQLAERIKVAINQHNWSGLSNEEVSVSIGLAQFESNNHEDLTALIKQADDLMYKAKAQGKNAVCFA